MAKAKNTSESKPDCLTVADVARRRGISEKTIYRRIDAGKLKARKEGNLWQIELADYFAYVDSLPCSRQ